MASAQEEGELIIAIVEAEGEAANIPAERLAIVPVPAGRLSIVPVPAGRAPMVPARRAPMVPAGRVWPGRAPMVPAGRVWPGRAPMVPAGRVWPRGIRIVPIDPPQRGLIDESRDRLNRKTMTAFLVVVTLFTSVTIGALFAVPLDKFISNPSIGVWKHRIGQAFILGDIGAICSAVVSIVLLTLGHIGDDRLVTAALELSAALITLCLMMMTVAFSAGLVMVGWSVSWVPFIVVVLGLGIIFGIAVVMFPLFVRRARWTYSLSVFRAYWRQMVSR